ncbi:DgyrCDS12654 [Dimorphilus gyrociliatus]|uniref:DgyrCDS12654 n=1 Tax=Dimorphilus gyrociliatus TaxID=2664684 RepID=A0A7I8W748_9ANNE|nr:DgyrCDS12654 [Dimorphilus gyrociliatus]
MPVLSSPASLQNFTDASVQKLLNCLQELHLKASGNEIDLLFLSNLLQGEDFQGLMKIHQQVTAPQFSEHKPTHSSASKMVANVVEDLHAIPPTAEARELMTLLCSFSFQGLLEAHDGIAAKAFSPVLPEIPHKVDEDEVSVKILKLLKAPKEPLGATIKKNEKTGCIHVARIMKGGAADRSGVISVGDELREVNDVCTRSMDPNEVVSLLTNPTGPLILKLIPADSDIAIRETHMRVKACFEFDPKKDSTIPCKEAGLAFKRNDILHIVSQEDGTWWQARLDSDSSKRAGLIPSIKRLERQEAAKTLVNTPECERKLSTKFSPKIGKRRRFKKDQEVSDDVIIPTFYEEVDKFTPEKSRNILLAGHALSGRDEILSRLQIKLNNSKYKIPTRYSTNLQPNCSMLPKEDIDRLQQEKLLIDFLDRKQYSICSKLEDARQIIKNGDALLCSVNQQGLKLLRTAEVKPFVIYIKPHSTDCLKSMHKSVLRSPGAKRLNDDGIEEVMVDSSLMENSYGHFFDRTVLNRDIQASTDEILNIINQANTTPCWVPSVWMQ